MPPRPKAKVMWLKYGPFPRRALAPPSGRRGEVRARRSSARAHRLSVRAEGHPHADVVIGKRAVNLQLFSSRDKGHRVSAPPHLHTAAPSPQHTKVPSAAEATSAPTQQWGVSEGAYWHAPNTHLEPHICIYNVLGAQAPQKTNTLLIHTWGTSQGICCLAVGYVFDSFALQFCCSLER